MKVRDNFSQIYLNKIKNKLSILEIERNKSMNLFLISASLGNVLLLKVYKIMLHHNVQYLAFALAAFITFLCYYFSFKAYKKSYKEKVIHSFFQEILTDTIYLPDSHLTESEYQASLLFQGEYTHFSGEDLVEGKLNGTPIRLSELMIKRVQQNGKKRKTVLVFKGLLAIYYFPHQYQSETIIEPDYAEKLLGKYFGNLLQTDIFGEHKHVNLESPDFEKEFVVRSLDQVEARLILTPHVQDTLTKIKQKNEFNFAMSFTPNMMAFAFRTTKNLFEAPTFSNCIETKSFRDIVDIFSFIHDVSNTVDSKIKKI